MITIRRKQLKIFEDLTMFEQRILCHKLPNSFDSITIVDNNEEQCLNKRRKIIQDLKRQLLYVELQQYEIQIQHYEDLYEQEINAFLRHTTTNSYQTNDNSSKSHRNHRHHRDENDYHHKYSSRHRSKSREHRR